MTESASSDHRLIRARWAWSERPLLAHRAAIGLAARSSYRGAWWHLLIRDTQRRNPAWSEWFKGRGPKPPENTPYWLYNTKMDCREPPLPFNSVASVCPVCGQKAFPGGTWRAPGHGPGRPRWHAACVTAVKFWRDPSCYAAELAARQGWRCAYSGIEIATRVQKPWGGYMQFTRKVDIDHLVPLWRVAQDAPRYQWPAVLQFWGPGNLRVCTVSAHKEKTRREARDRAATGGRSWPEDQHGSVIS